MAHGFPSCAAHSEVIDSHRLKISTPHRTEGRSPHGLKTKNMVESEFILLGTSETQTVSPGRCWHQIGMA